MKLQDLEVIITAPPAPGWGGRYWILVKLTTDTGLIGWGECYAASVGPKAMAHVIADVFGRHMQNEHPENIEKMFRRVYSSGFTLYQYFHFSAGIVGYNIKSFFEIIH